MNLRQGAAGLVLAFALLGGVSSAQAECLQTGLIRDGIDLTAARIGSPRVRDKDLDATGCDMAVYYPPDPSGIVHIVHDTKIRGARYFGVVVNGAIVHITLSEIYDIGNVPFDGASHGVAIYCAHDSGLPSIIRIRQNVIRNYQKDGVVADETCTGLIEDNSIAGRGRVDLIAQSGIRLKSTSKMAVSRNSIFAHSYTGSGGVTAAGVRVVGGDCFGGPLAQKNYFVRNIVTANDVGFSVLNLGANCSSAPSTPTGNVFDTNTVDYGWVTNTSGNGSAGYQYAFSIALMGDTLENNILCGHGYDPANPANQNGGSVGDIDAAGSGALTLTDNGCVGPRRAAVVERSRTRSARQATLLKKLGVIK